MQSTVLGAGLFFAGYLLFIYEGLPTVLLGLLCFFYVDDDLGRARWLSDAEKRLVAAALKAENSSGDAKRHATFRQALLDPRVYVLALAYLSILAGTQAVALWTPTLLHRFGIGTTLVGVLGAVPFVIAVAGMLLLGRSPDRRLERRWYFAGAIWLGSACLAAFGLIPDNLITTILLLGGVAGGSWAAQDMRIHSIETTLFDLLTTAWSALLWQSRDRSPAGEVGGRRQG